MIYAIVHADKEWGIGKGNDMMFSLPADMKFFRTTTMGNTVGIRLFFLVISIAPKITQQSAGTKSSIKRSKNKNSPLYERTNPTVRIAAAAKKRSAATIAKGESGESVRLLYDIIFSRVYEIYSKDEKPNIWCFFVELSTIYCTM